MSELVQDSPLRVMKLVNVQKIEHCIERVTEICVHPRTFLDFMEVDHGFVGFEARVYFVVRGVSF